MGKKILIVDDEPDILALVVIRLETSGYEVSVAADSEAALEELGKNIPDLILLDLLLPNMQGDELCIKLKRDKRYKSIPIIIFTAVVMRIDDNIKRMMADDYILKPFEPDELLFKVKKFIG